MAESANPDVSEQEQDVMRDLLDTVSTTATRASSIAGSLLDLESRAGSVTGETGRATNYSFSEPGKASQFLFMKKSFQKSMNPPPKHCTKLVTVSFG